MTEGHVEHHWEWSYFPLILSLGIFFTVPLGFASYFEYQNGLMAAMFLGLGVPLIIIGVVGWASEGIAGAATEPGYAMTGLPIFIVSETMIFMALFVSYWVLRLGADVWPPPGSPYIGVVMPIIMTVILVSSSITYHQGELWLEAGSLARFRTWTIITLVLGTIFLSFTIFEYRYLIDAGFTFGTNAKSTIFYSITGFHASHVVLGLCIFLIVLVPAMSGKVSHTFVKGAGLYWHFVDLIWLFVVSQVYFW